MKTKSVKITGILLMSALTLSVLFKCSQHESLQKPNVTSEDFLASTQFSALGISKENLNITAAQEGTTKMGRKTFVFPVIGQQNSVVVGVVDSKTNRMVAFKFEVQSQISTQEMTQSWNGGQFNGSFNWTSGDVQFKCDFKNSVLASVENTASQSQQNSREEYYGKTCSTDNVMNCAGDSFTSQGPFSKAMCVAEFPVCMATLAADCWYELCASA